MKARDTLPFLFLAALCAGLYVRAFHPAPPIYDEAFYRALAGSLRDGTGYTAVWAPEPGPPRFPPGYPLFLSGVLAATPSDAAPRAASILLTLAVLFALHRMFRKTPWGWFVPALFGTHALTVSFSGQMMSEPLFLLLSYSSLALALRAEETGDRSLFLAAFLLSLLSAFTRTVGWTLPACLLLARLRKPALREVAPLFLLAAGAFLIFLRVTRTGEYVGLWSPAAQGKMFIAHFLENALVHFGRNMADALTGLWTAGVTRAGSATPLFALKSLASLALGLIVLRGWWKRLRGPASTVPELYYAAYTLTCLGWEIYKFDDRLFLPILPLTLHYGIAEMHSMLGGRGKPVKILLSGMLILFAAKSFARSPRPAPDPAAENFLAACAWLAAQTPPDAVVYSYAPAGVYLHARRRSLKPDEWPETERPWQTRPGYFLSDDRFDDANGRFAARARVVDDPLFATPDGRMKVLRIAPLTGEIRGRA